MNNVLGVMTHYAVLTYPKEFPLDGPTVKYHLQKMKQRLLYKKLRMFWFMEFQRRGAVHFNLLLDVAVDEEEFRRMWYEVVGSGDPKHLTHGAYIEPIETPEGMLHYLTGYLTKQGQKRVPDLFREVGRFWGYSRSALPKIIKIIVGLPQELRTLRGHHPALFMLLRWDKAQRHLWLKEAKARGWKRSKRNPSPYARYILRDSYVTINNARRFIDELRRHGMDTSLFEAEGGAQTSGLKPAGGAPLTLYPYLKKGI